MICKHKETGSDSFIFWHLTFLICYLIRRFSRRGSAQMTNDKCQMINDLDPYPCSSSHHARPFPLAQCTNAFLKVRFFAVEIVRAIVS